MSTPNTPTGPGAAVRALLLVLMSAAAGLAQLPGQPLPEHFLGRPSPDGYVNYGEHIYQPYRRQILLAPRYDYLGNFLTEGFLVYEMDEQRPGSSVIRKDRLYRSLNNLIIAHDNYGPWNWALTVGDEIRTELTRLTFYRATFNGLRWDVVFPGNKLTLLTARGFDSSTFPTLQTFSSPIDRGTGVLTEYLRREEENPVFTFGGHWETRLGDVLRFGATLVNQHQVNAARSGDGGLLRGSIPYPEMQAPAELTVRIRDDAPDHPETGAVVYAVFIEVETAEQTVLSSDPDDARYDARLRPEVLGGRRGDGYRSAYGDEHVDFIFPLPEEEAIRGVRVRAVVANDYRIEVAQRHAFFLPVQARFEDRRTPFQTMVRARGAVADFSNRREVVFDYGLNSGQTLFGVDAEVHLYGLRLHGEYKRSLLDRAFPVRHGRRSRESSSAWYLTGLRRLEPFELGGEVFHLGPAYSGGYDSRRGGLILYTDKAGGAEDMAMLSEFPLVDDNDDNGRYADDDMRAYFDAGEVDSGVFPGLQKTGYHVLDYDRNANGIPDYLEPFLLYFSDPPDFVYGIDMNNNGVIDERENNDKPQYPYDRNRRGWHAFLSLPERQGFSAAVGYYRQRMLAGPGRAVSRYVRCAYFVDWPRRGRLQLNHDTKRVQDTIPDPVYIYRPGEHNNPDRPPPPDPLLMQDSWVHTTFVGTEMRRIAGLHVENNAQWIVNRQLQENARIQTFTLVNKTDYPIDRGRLRIHPMFKHLFKWVDRSDRRRPLESWHQIAPIVRVDLQLTEQTAVQFGQQGLGIPFTRTLFKPLAFHQIDRVDATRDHRSMDSVLMFTVHSDYQGYQVVSNTGLQRRHEVYSDPVVARTRDGGYFGFFITLIAGYDR